MTFIAGTKLGTYEIVGPLGKGGMGEVYRARDSRLKREVAIKVLPDEFCRDAERVSRFQREAEVLASLNHPHIAAIHHLEEYEKSRFLVLELVEGETLADRIARGPLPVDEAVEIAKQIAEALEAAHEKGIVHRDLKPTNIKITPEGKVKVLDFGLAKVYEAETSTENLSQSPTLMSARTGGGVILGTVSYMSPEQARGRPVTKQTDIWAFGCVLFEMLTGHMAFSGETVSDTIVKILKEEPDWNEMNTAVPQPLRRIVERCLLKDSRRRFHDAGDIRFDLEEALTIRPPAIPAESPGKRSAVLLAGVLLISILIGGGLWLRPRTDTSVPVWTGTLLGGPAIAFGPRVSPDGKLVAFIALIDRVSQVAVMNPKSGNWTVLTHDRIAGLVDFLSWSKDGTKIYFERHDALPLGIYSIPALGGEPRLLLENAANPEVLSDDSLIIVRVNADRIDQLYRFRLDTGELQPLNALLSPIPTNFPKAAFRAFPDGEQVVFFGKPADSSSGKNSGPSLRILDLKSNTSRPFGPELNRGPFTTFGLAVNPEDRSVLVTISNGDLQQILAISTDGTNQSRVLLTLTERTGFIDMAADGSLYVDQIARPMEAVRFTESAQAAQPVAVVPVGKWPVLELPDKRLLLTSYFEGRSRLLVAKPTGELSPFVDTDEETRGPVTFAGPDQVAFILGKPPQQSIAIASIKDGRILRRRQVMAADLISSLSASSDGATLFYSEAGSIWSIPVADGDPRKLGPGDAVAFDPLQQNLVVQLNEKDGVRLVRIPASGGPAEPIPMHGDLRIPPTTFLGPNAVRKDGQIVFPVAFKDSWFYGAAILDPTTGDVRRISLRYDADLFAFSWNQKNEIVTAGFLMRSSIWRFRSEPRK